MAKGLKIFVLIFILFKSHSTIILAQSRNFDNSILWEIKDNKSGKSSYIFGSLHLLDSNAVHLPIKQIQSLIDKCELLCSETGDNNIKPSKELLRFMFLQENTTNITNSLEIEDLKELLLIIDSAKTDLKTLKPTLKRMRPNVLSTLIDVEAQVNQANFKSLNFQTEKYFVAYAKNKGHKIVGLETLQQQFEWIFNPSLSFEDGLILLKKSIHDFNSKPSEISLTDRYRKQKISKLLPEASYTEALMVDRNQKMAESILNLIQKNTAFIIVGAAHLSYDTGILNLLAEKGLEVNSIKVKL